MEDFNFYINKYVFYRRYGDFILLYHTKLKKGFVFNFIVEDILNICKGGTTFQNIIANMLLLYNIEDKDGLRADIQEIINKLLENNILDLIKKDGKYDPEAIEFRFSKITASQKALFSVIFELTYKCNEHCVHCYINHNNKKEINTKKTLQIIDELYEMGVLCLTFTGGEVFLRKDFMKILEYAVHKGFAVDIFSNATLITDYEIIKIASLGIKSFHCSFYSYLPEKHDAITKLTGSFNKSLSNIKKLISLQVPVNIKTVAMRHNQDDFEGLLQMANEIGATLQIGLFISPMNDGNLSPTNLRIDDKEKIENIIKLGQGFIDQDIFRVDDRDIEDSVCGAGLNSVSINPYGDVFACMALPIPVGNLINSRMHDIWNKSEKLSEIRNKKFKDIKGCESCADKKYCNFCMGTAYLEKGNLTSQYDEACFVTQAKVKILNSKKKGGE